MKQVGLTDYPSQQQREHGNPVDWWQRSFLSESEASHWAKHVLAMPGYAGGQGNGGWRYGYTYTITPDTIQ